MGHATIRDLSDYVDFVKEKYPEMETKDILKILRFGFRAYYRVILWSKGVWVGRGKRKAFIGNYSEEYGNRQIQKICRWRWNRKQKEYDGYYYFVMSAEKFEQLSKRKLNKRAPLEFKKIMLYRDPIECKRRHIFSKHFFRVPYPLDCGAYMYKGKFITDQYQYLGLWAKRKLPRTGSLKVEIPTSTRRQPQTKS